MDRLHQVTASTWSKPQRTTTRIVLGLVLLCLISLHQVWTAVRLGPTTRATETELGILAILSHSGNKTVGRPSQSFPNETFSACLLVMDDNHKLREWLAYHYFALPLRTLIVAVDPYSLTKPTHVLDLWRKYQGMTILEWTDDDFLPYNHSSRYYQSHETHEELHAKHVFRQSTFYKQCAHHLKVHYNASWTAFIDTDEFLTFNPGKVPNSDDLLKQPGSILRWIKDTKRYNKTTLSHVWPYSKLLFDEEVYNGTTSICPPLPRLLYNAQDTLVNGTNEIDQSIVAKNVPSYVNATQFLTLRYRYPANKRSHKNGPTKSIADLTKVPMDVFSRSSGGPHKPLPGICLLGTWGYKDMPLVVHHYLGSWESFSYRTNDSRNHNETGRNYYRWEKQNARNGGEPDDAIRSWISGFVDYVGGKERAKLLLDRVGVLEPKPTT